MRSVLCYRKAHILNLTQIHIKFIDFISIMNLFLSKMIMIMIMGVNALYVSRPTTLSLRNSRLYSTHNFRRICHHTRLMSPQNTEKEEVRVGTKEYYSGFISRDLKEEDDRISGDKVLIPTLKFIGGFTLIIGLLFIGFLASNGIL